MARAWHVQSMRMRVQSMRMRVQVDTLVDSLPLCMLIMGQKNSDVVTMYS